VRVVLNKQSRVGVDIGGTRRFVGKLRRTLKLGRRDFTVCLVDDRAIRRLNCVFRGQDRPTDVLSFPWRNGFTPSKGGRAEERELGAYLGDIVISAESARRNARAERHPAGREIFWLILHGALHLLGYDHETDSGEMNGLERRLRARLSID
jgi:probable rRNA maturation factor